MKSYASKTQFHTALVVAALTVGLIGCGGGGGGGGGAENGGPTVQTGKFVDSPVGGLSYRTATRSGQTEADGSFRYLDGEIVTFGFGNLEIGSATGQEFVTPLDLVNTPFVDDDRVVNMARLLQSLDVDFNPANGIELLESVNELELPEGFEVSLDDADSISALLEEIDANRGTLGLVPAEQALAHLEETLASLPSGDAVGTEPRVFESIAIGLWNATDPARVESCTPWTSATLTAQVLDETQIHLTGTLTDSTGGSESFDFTGTHGRFGRGNGQTDAGTPMAVAIDFSGINPVQRTEMRVNQREDCESRIYLKETNVDTAPPTANVGFGGLRMAICSGTFWQDDLSHSWNMTSHSPNGYLLGNPEFTVTADAGEATVHVIPARLAPIFGDLDVHTEIWGTRVPERTDRVVVTGLPCGSSYTWEYRVEDNAGQVHVATGSHMGEPIDDDDNGQPTGAQFEYCAENYSLRHCQGITWSSLPENVNQIMVDSNFNPQTGLRTGGLCAGFIPQTGPNAVIQNFSTTDGTQIALPDGTTLNPEPSSLTPYGPDDVGSCYICARPLEECSNYFD